MTRIKRYYLNRRNGGKGSSLETQIYTIRNLGGTQIDTEKSTVNMPEVVCFDATDESKADIEAAFDHAYIVDYHWKYKTREDCLNDVL